jgi:hypothetical protein
MQGFGSSAPDVPFGRAFHVPTTLEPVSFVAGCLGHRRRGRGLRLAPQLFDHRRWRLRLRGGLGFLPAALTFLPVLFLLGPAAALLLFGLQAALLDRHAPAHGVERGLRGGAPLRPGAGDLLVEAVRDVGRLFEVALDGLQACPESRQRDIGTLDTFGFAHLEAQGILRGRVGGEAERRIRHELR